MEEIYIHDNNSRLLVSPSAPSSAAGFTPPSPVELSKAVILGLFCALGIPGNVVVLALLLRKLERNNFTELLMLNLACCDLLYLTTLPVWVVHAIRRRDIHPALCRLVSFVVFCSLYVNIFTITLMSVQRFLKVLHHHRWSQLGQRGERALLVGLWAGSCVLTWPSVASTGWTEDRHFECSRPSRMEGLALGATVVELLLGFVVPFSVMTSFYCCLYRRVKERPALSANRRTSQLISRIIVTFLVLWVPIHVVGMVGLVGTSLRASRPDLASRLDRFTDRAMIVKNLPLLSAIIDPFLYAYSFSKLWPRNNPNPNPS